MVASPRLKKGDERLPAGQRDEAPDATREIGAKARFDGPAEATALIDAESMEGLQASSRRGSSVPPASDAELTRNIEPGKLSELMSGTSVPPAPTRLDRAPANPDPLVVSARSRYTPTLQSAQLAAAPRPAIWPVLVGTVLFGAGLGAFLAIRPKVSAPIPASESVELRIRAKPDNATIRLDGKALSGNPAQTMQKRGSARRRVTVDAPGFDSQTLEVALDADSLVDVSLEKTMTDSAKTP